MVKKKRKAWGVAVFMLLMGALLAANAGAAEVDVYAEGAYTDTDLVVYIYADIPEPILSFGVKVEFAPADLQVTAAEKNEADWYFGSDTTTYEYMAPEIDNTAGTVVIIGGKLDTESPTAGVSGDRVLLGKVTFDRLTENIPAITLTFGREGAFANFVKPTLPEPTVLDTQTVPEDGVGFAVTVRERGDANADGVINVQDILRAKTLIGNPSAPPYADCNATEDINVQDILCIKSKI